MSVEEQLKEINKWQVEHEKADIEAFKAIEKKHEEDHQELKEMLKPVLELIGNMGFSKKLMFGVMAFTGSVVGILLGIIKIITMLK